MLFSTFRRIRLVPVLFTLVAALMFAPSAFAGGHYSNWGVSVGFSGPGYSIGYNDCRNCGGGYVTGSFYGGYGGYGSSYGGYGNYYGGYGGAYYAPTRYPVHYPSYGPGYGGAYYRYSSYRPYRGYRPVAVPVARRVVYYDNYYSEVRRDSIQYRDDPYPNADRYVNDRGYSRRAAYYDRD